MKDSLKPEMFTHLAHWYIWRVSTKRKRGMTLEFWQCYLDGIEEKVRKSSHKERS